MRFITILVLSIFYPEIVKCDDNESPGVSVPIIVLLVLLVLAGYACFWLSEEGQDTVTEVPRVEISEAPRRENSGVTRREIIEVPSTGKGVFCSIAFYLATFKISN